MARQKSKCKSKAFILFNVTYQDGIITSNQWIPVDQLDQSFGSDVIDLAQVAIKE